MLVLLVCVVCVLVSVWLEGVTESVSHQYVQGLMCATDLLSISFDLGVMV